MASFFNSLFGNTTHTTGETKSSANIAAETLGNPEPDPTTSTTTTSSPTLRQPSTNKDFTQFRQISLPGEWAHDNPDDEVGSGKFKFGFESLRTVDEICIEFDKLTHQPTGPKHTFITATQQLQQTALWNEQVQLRYHQVVASYDAHSALSLSTPSTPSTTHTQQHIYGVALYTSSSPECRHKTTLTFAQGDLLRLERKDNDTWNARVQGAAPVSGCPFAAMGGSKGEVHTSLIQVVCTMYRLHKTCEEYQKVAKLFEPSCTNGTTSCSTFHVDRVQNTALWQDFYLLRERLFRRLGAEGLNEKLLWHGCSGPVVLPIASGGFDWRLCGLHGTAYGRGAYFAKKSTYSQNNAYSKPDATTGLKHLFLTRVLVGRTCQGTSTLQRPPLGVHSAINGTNEKTAGIFVTFEISQSFPLYHVTFKK